MKLNDRLKAIADEIEKGQTMADIGTDHGFLPLYLWENDICPQVIMADISVGSLNKAKETFSCIGKHDHKQIAGGNVSFRLGNGLDVINAGEVDVAVIAGMGGVLMTQIIGSNINKALSLQKVILQPRNGSGKLRYWLNEAGFEITSESLAKEGKFICEILVVRPPGSVKELPSLENYPDEISYEIPIRLRSESEELFNIHIMKKIEVEKKILKDITDGKGCDLKKKAKTESRIEFLSGIKRERHYEL